MSDTPSAERIADIRETYVDGTTISSVSAVFAVQELLAHIDRLSSELAMANASGTEVGRRYHALQEKAQALQAERTDTALLVAAERMAAAIEVLGLAYLLETGASDPDDDVADHAQQALDAYRALRPAQPAGSEATP